MLTTPVTFFIGENGSGKSTLLRALANRSRIHIWKDDEIVRSERNPYAESLYRFMTLEWSNGSVPGSYFDSELSRNFARYLDEWAAADPDIISYFGGRSLLTQSHGQSLMSFFDARYRFRGLHLLDEPETALSPASELALLDLIQRRSAAGHAQFVIATHSPILMACPGATIYCFDRVPLASIAYEDTAHYRIYRDFLINRDKYLEEEDEGKPHPQF
jgi:predicted ATPase